MGLWMKPIRKTWDDSRFSLDKQALSQYILV